MDLYPHWEIEPMEEKINKSNFHQYWIIKKQTDDIYGALTKEEYFEKRISCIHEPSNRFFQQTLEEMNPFGWKNSVNRHSNL